MNEDFLHFIWKFKNFIYKYLQTTEGLPLSIIKAGEHNFNAGPDFLNARIKIGDKIWAGSVEIHIKTSHWQQHNHSTDDAYNNVILHVVYEDDAPGLLTIPCLELKNLINPNSLAHYHLLKTSKEWIPCATQIQQVEEFTKSFWLERMAAERLEIKALAVLKTLKSNNNDWAETFYQLSGKNFGFKINSPAFEALTKSLPQKLLSKHRHNYLQIEALLFGQAGMLETDFTDEYPNSLKREYDFLRKKYNLIHLQLHQWKYLRLRPPNFPTIRISQFAALAHKSVHLFSQILETENYQDLISLFEVKASSYWDDHFIWDKEVQKKTEKWLGNESINNIIINTIIPTLFAYGIAKNSIIYKEKAFSLLEEIPAEINNITEGWKKLGFRNKNAYESQALIHLRNNYCDNKQCLKCAIGTKILKRVDF